jgi:hypothetical protein
MLVGLSPLSEILGKPGLTTREEAIELARSAGLGRCALGRASWSP